MSIRSVENYPVLPVCLQLMCAALKELTRCLKLQRYRVSICDCYEIHE